jgi:hypothetical protein
MSATINVRYLNTAVYSYKVEYVKAGVPTTGVNVSPIISDQAESVFITPLNNAVSGLPVALEIPVGVTCMYVVVTTYPGSLSNSSTFSVALEVTSSDSTSCLASVNPFSAAGCGSRSWWVWAFVFFIFLLLLLLAIFGTRYLCC